MKSGDRITARNASRALGAPPGLDWLRHRAMVTPSRKDAITSAMEPSSSARPPRTAGSGVRRASGEPTGAARSRRRRRTMRVASSDDANVVSASTASSQRGESDVAIGRTADAGLANGAPAAGSRARVTGTTKLAPPRLSAARRPGRSRPRARSRRARGRRAATSPGARAGAPPAAGAAGWFRRLRDRRRCLGAGSAGT